MVFVRTGGIVWRTLLTFATISFMFFLYFQSNFLSRYSSTSPFFSEFVSSEYFWNRKFSFLFSLRKWWRNWRLQSPSVGNRFARIQSSVWLTHPRWFDSFRSADGIARLFPDISVCQVADTTFAQVAVILFYHSTCWQGVYRSRRIADGSTIVLVTKVIEFKVDRVRRCVCSLCGEV